MDIEKYSPISTLNVKETLLRKSKYPFIDVHNHQFDMPIKNLDNLVFEMDSLNMAFMVNLSGFRGLYLKKSLDNINETAPTRFGLFVNIDFEKIDEPDFKSNTLKIIRDAVNDGVIGLKVYKSLGLTDKDSNGNRISVNDPRLDPIWDLCGKLNIPVLIHTGEPEPFWLDKNKYNERWLELRQKPGRYRGDSTKFPTFKTLMHEQHDIFRKNPETIFINAHMGWMANDLNALSDHLDEHKNVMTEIGAVLAELGRQPNRAREFLIKYKNRILFGKDSYNISEYFTYFRVLETDDEYFDYYRKRHAHWKMYGLSLPDSVLKSLYYENALKLFPSINKNLFLK
ncbi:MAG: amidohydrolase family protein [Flavobacteriaceae bacterium]|nr:amidohydrolase family protein [Flavobacteriaceae bacterium]